MAYRLRKPPSWPQPGPRPAAAPGRGPNLRRPRSRRSVLRRRRRPARVVMTAFKEMYRVLEPVLGDQWLGAWTRISTTRPTSPAPPTMRSAWVDRRHWRSSRAMGPNSISVGRSGLRDGAAPLRRHRSGSREPPAALRPLRRRGDDRGPSRPPTASCSAPGAGRRMPSDAPGACRSKCRRRRRRKIAGAPTKAEAAEFCRVSVRTFEREVYSLTFRRSGSERASSSIRRTCSDGSTKEGMDHLLRRATRRLLRPLHARGPTLHSPHGRERSWPAARRGQRASTPRLFPVRRGVAGK